MFKIFSLLLIAVFLNAGHLNIVDGKIKAHTEVFGDSTIDPETKEISSVLTMDDSIESIKGMVSIKSLSLKSDNEKRDINMYETINSNNQPLISFKFTNIEKNEDFYLISGILNLNGQNKEIISKAKIEDFQNNLKIDGDFSFNLTDFGIEPPTLLFLTVRNQIDIAYNLKYTKE